MNIKQIFDNNQKWIAEKLKVNEDYFRNLAQGQNPEILYSLVSYFASVFILPCLYLCTFQNSLYFLNSMLLSGAPLNWDSVLLSVH